MYRGDAVARVVVGDGDALDQRVLLLFLRAALFLQLALDGTKPAGEEQRLDHRDQRGGKKRGEGRVLVQKAFNVVMRITSSGL